MIEDKNSGNTPTTSSGAADLPPLGENDNSSNIADSAAEEVTLKSKEAVNKVTLMLQQFL